MTTPTEGPDNLIGTAGADTIYGLGGNDTITGLSGDDILFGGQGDDLIYGSDDQDLILGQDGNDTAHGGGGNDTLGDGLGTDVIFGDEGDDYILVGDPRAPYENDTFDGGPGFDTIVIETFSDYDRLNFSTYVHVSGFEQLISMAILTMTIAQIGQFQAIDVPILIVGDSGSLSLTAAPSTISLNSAGNAVDLSGIVTSPYPIAVIGREGNDSVEGSQVGDHLIGGAGDDTLRGNGGNDTLTGDSGSNLLVGGAGDDTYYTDNPLDVLVEADNGGTDTIVTSNDYTLPGAFENLTLFGSSGHIGNGNAANNIIMVSGGPDTIHGGDGNDTISGGGRFLYGDAGDDQIMTGGARILIDGGSGFDSIVVQGFGFNDTIVVRDEDAIDGGNVSFLRIDFSGAEANTTLDLQAQWSGGTTLYGARGSITGARSIDTYVGSAFNDVLIAGDGLAYGFSTKASGGNDRVVGSGGPDRLVTGAGDDTLEGGGSNDTLDAGTGTDQVYGQAGNDLLMTYSAFSAGTIFDGGDGTDFLRIELFGTAALSLDLTGYWATHSLVTGGVTLRDIEKFTLLLADGDDSVVFGAGATDNLLINGWGGNDLLGTGTGDDTLDGGDGADTLVGGAGNDTYVVDQAGDTITELAGEGTDTVRTALIAYMLTAANVENLVYTGSSAASLTGNGLANQITGGGGNDTLDGGAGSDTLAGGAGNDAYVVDDVRDLAIEASGADGTDTVMASVSFTLGPNIENLVLLGSGNLVGTGNSLANAITGNAGNDVIDGGAGNDTLYGGPGADTMSGGADNDTYFVNNPGDVVIEASGQGTDEVQTSLAAYTLTANVERLFFNGTGATALTGNALANQITGGAGNDTLDGGIGADALTGGLGDDTYLVDDAGDSVVEGANGGTDTVLTVLASYTLASEVERVTFTGSGPASLTGNAASNILTGGGDNDLLLGQAGDDTLVGGAGADTLTGGAGNDSLDGGAGFDVATFGAASAQASVTRLPGGGLLVSTPVDGTDTLHAIEQVRFADGLRSFVFNAPGSVLVANFAPGAGGWSSQDIYPRHAADVNGDGKADIIGFGQAGVWVSLAGANGSFGAPTLVVSNFGQSAGWSTDDQFHRVLADVNGDGRADVIGFGIAGTWVSLATAGGSFAAPSMVVANFGANQGWSSQNGFARTMGDVNGDGSADVIGFGIAGTWVALANGDGTFQAAKFAVANFGAQQGWSSDAAFHRTLADVNGDGKADVVGFGIAGTLVALSNGDGTFGAATLTLPDFGANQGWTSNDAYPRYSADVNGDGKADLVGFGQAGTLVAFGKGDGTFTQASLDIANFGQAQGWSSDTTYHRELADLDGDGLVDIVGFGQAGVYGALNQADLLI
ncbi:beta strand repeat-containing protein [Novosphingobium bradum]|uniref:Beta strand repeat-containing protein n=1 Tax=Novosphingobium bradum TaxID=1737444 RepID=A0ABV7IU36_9SPHN